MSGTKFKTRLRRELPKDPAYRIGYDQGYLDVSNSVLSFLEQKFLDGPDRPKKGTPEYQYFIKSVRELSAHLRKERDKAAARVSSSNAEKK